MVASAAKVVVEEGKALRNVPRVASDIPDIGQAAVKGPLALSKSARAGLIAVNALFLGMDIFFICKDSISLAKGSETEVSQFIRARAALWSSEIDSWKKIHDSLCEDNWSTLLQLSGCVTGRQLDPNATHPATVMLEQSLKKFGSACTDRLIQLS
ncbi:hypothetical protein L3Q82_002646 [Scortum barcoo]|uniref:Uncharacterized protein n=1 Tax=Scortum barcoo TaxID=214431 RepID=A0ACB8VUF3_9TELE|nr:hypothetical protein L3Q82_002646 [Scortum barcoo]